jgi:hypothetical protein
MAMLPYSFILDTRKQNVLIVSGGEAVAYWLRHYAASRQVAGSIPDEVIRFFNRPNPSSRTLALRSTQPLTEMSTRIFLEGKGQPACKAESLTTICEPIV